MWTVEVQMTTQDGLHDIPLTWYCDTQHEAETVIEGLMQSLGKTDICWCYNLYQVLPVEDEKIEWESMKVTPIKEPVCEATGEPCVQQVNDYYCVTCGHQREEDC
jgi:hypothetical protein|tara:strand:+ start:1176 stop:1490 length:315 start_codon:yes stop_codon:yes gene_type:complete